MVNASWREEMATKGYVHDAMDTLLAGMQLMFDAQNEKLDKRFDKIDKRFDRLEKGQKELRKDVKNLKSDVKNLKADVQDLKNDVKDLKNETREINDKIDDLPMTYVTKEEYHSLRKKMYRHHPVS